ncbi:MAG: hypothetical protein HKL90_04115, partial [Elusimicrobia bacterium]|nr:hypothetical protein [Elusimicrobiota bacterium]
MNAERLNKLSQMIQAELNSTNEVGLLQAITATLQNLVNQPQAPNLQQTLGAQTTQLLAALDNVPSDSLTPTWREILKDIGGDELLGKQLKQQIENIFSRNKITFALALQEMRLIHQRVQEFKNGIDQAALAFKQLRIETEELEPGECEFGILIPRDAVDNKFGRFSDELEEFNFILGTFSEIVLGSKADIEIRTLSSSELLIFLKISSHVAVCLAAAVERVRAPDQSGHHSGAKRPPFRSKAATVPDKAATLV